MTRREEYQAGHEALQEVTSQPRERPHESAMARFVAGIAYEERRHDRERDNDEQETRDDHTSKPE